MGVLSLALPLEVVIPGGIGRGGVGCFGTKVFVCRTLFPTAVSDQTGSPTNKRPTVGVGLVGDGRVGLVGVGIGWTTGGAGRSG